ncbi:hypothetical protein JDO7802_01846 [Jannaschia donghaensis]|uniref:Uncharacterized protein n=1 Tax=Jannaschia donghaensis TaxID=420998 RepID=A0A0M6YJ65_9RHOB|nr:hypothetical protein JDO7802_01846 [Jannaschia donghaensis]
MTDFFMLAAAVFAAVVAVRLLTLHWTRVDDDSQPDTEI